MHQTMNLGFAVATTMPLLVKRASDVAMAITTLLHTMLTAASLVSTAAGFAANYQTVWFASG